MKLKKLGAYIAAFLLIMNSISAPAMLALADDGAQTVSATEETAPAAAPQPVATPQSVETVSTVPETPAEPATPAAPETPAEPATPAAPETPAEPATPAAPETPAEPATPAAPEKTTEPSEPVGTAAPEKTTEPSEPVGTTAPEGTTEPSEPVGTTAPEGTTDPTATAAPEETPEPTETVEPTETPVPEETVEPTATPIPLSLRDLASDKAEYAPGDLITWHFACEGADSVTYEVRNSQGAVVQSGTPEEGNKISFQTEACDTYTLTVTAAAGEETLSATSAISVVAVEEETPTLTLAVEKTEYVPGDPVTWHIACEGVDSVTYEIANSQGAVVQSGAPEEGNVISFQTEECDTYTLTVTATAGEETLSATSTISVVKPELSLTLTVEKTVYAPGEPVIWHFECAGADSLAYEIRNTPGDVVASAAIEEGNEISFQTDACDAYTLTLTATAGEEVLIETSTVYVTSGDVAITMATDLRYAVANESPIDFQVEILGGIAPYTVAVQAVVEDAVVYDQTTQAAQPGVLPLSVMPTVFGVHTLTVTVTDAAGTTVQATLQLPVAIREPESQEDWSASVGAASITGDWRDDLAAVARTQLGYQESARDFIIDEEGVLHGYTRYGAWNGDPYGDWNTAFVSFCLSYANIPSAHFPRSADCASWKNTLSAKGLYQDAAQGYTPAQGDLIFFNWSGSSTPECVGIVDEVSADTVYAIVGLPGQGVSRSGYSLSDARVIGYASMEAAMRKAGLLEPIVKTGPITLEARWEGETLGVGDVVTLTALDTEGAPVLWQCQTQEDGEWQLAQEGGDTFAFEVTQENCAWFWRAVYASDVANAEDASTQDAQPAEDAENTQATENTANAENAEGDEQ